MDPITSILSIAGIGASLFGSVMGLSSGLQAADIASKESAVSRDIVGLQEQENQQRQLAMQINARRTMVEQVRQSQMRQALALSTGVGQTGSTQGTGVKGGIFQAEAEGAFNIQGTQQQLQIGNQLFGIQGQISQQQQIMSTLQGQLATLEGKQSMYQGIASIGGSLARSAGPLGNILGNFFGNQGDQSTQGYSPTKMGYLYNQ